jgi:hypothetical protein
VAVLGGYACVRVRTSQGALTPRLWEESDAAPEVGFAWSRPFGESPIKVLAEPGNQPPRASVLGGIGVVAVGSDSTYDTYHWLLDPPALRLA